MKIDELKKQLGIVNLGVIIVLLVLSAAIPVTVNLVKKSQDTRNLATSSGNKDIICNSVTDAGSSYQGKAVCNYTFGGTTYSWDCDDLRNSFCVDGPVEPYCSTAMELKCEYGCEPNTNGGSCKTAPDVTCPSYCIEGCPTNSTICSDYCSSAMELKCEYGCEPNTNGGSCKTAPDVTCANEGESCYQKSCCNEGEELYCASDRKCHAYVTSTPVPPTSCDGHRLGTKECTAKGTYNECTASGWRNYSCQTGYTCNNNGICERVCLAREEKCFDTNTRGKCNDTGTEWLKLPCPRSSVCKIGPYGSATCEPIATPTALPPSQLKEVGSACKYNSECKSSYCPVTTYLCAINNACNVGDKKCSTDGKSIMECNTYKAWNTTSCDYRCDSALKKCTAPVCANGLGCPSGWSCNGDTISGTGSFASKYCTKGSVVSTPTGVSGKYPSMSVDQTIQLIKNALGM